MKHAIVALLLVLLFATSAQAGDPFLLHDLPLGSTLEKAKALISDLQPSESPEGTRVYKAAGPVGQAHDIRLIFVDDRLVSISFRTSPKSFEQARKALADIAGPLTPAEDGRLAYEARQDSRRLQLLRQDDESAWVVHIDLDRIGMEHQTR